MKKKIILVIVAVILVCAFFGTGMVVGAATYEPGTQGDPVVTLSYLNARLLEAGIASGTSADVSGASLSDTAPSFRQLKLASGEQLILEDGSMVIVYSGNGSVIGTTGLMNLSTSDIFPSGTSVVLYSLYLGMGSSSGIKAAGNMTVYVLGNCSVK